jgi:hypothetical protein
LIKTAHQHLLLLVGFDTLIYRKYYDTPPILVGHQSSPANVSPDLPPLHLIIPLALAHLSDVILFSFEFQNDEDDHDQISPSARPISDERLPEL